MNEILLLIKINFMNLLGINEFRKTKSKGEKTKKVLIVIAVVYAFVAILVGSFALFFMLSDTLIMIGQLNILIILAFLLATISSLITTIFKAPGYLFDFKDYDMLMSLPIKNSSILISKIFLLYLTNFIWSILFAMPPLIVYGIVTQSGFLYFVLVIILLMFLQIIPMVIGSVLSFIIGKISSNAKRGNLVLVLGSFVIILVLFVLMNNFKTISSSEIQSLAPTIQGITNIYFMTNIFLNAVEQMNLISFLVFIAINSAIFALFVIFLSGSFRTINAAMNENYTISQYKLSRLKQSSVLMALYKKEISFYFSSFGYILNTGFSVVMMTFFAFGTAIFGEKAVLTIINIPTFKNLLTPMITIIMAFCIGLTYITAPSISLEGKNLWIIKSLPIRYIDIIKSKILLNLTITIPIFLVDITVLNFTLGIKFVEYITIVLVCILYGVLTSLTGIIANLFFPKMEWQSQTVVVKQSASVLISTLLAFIYICIPGGVYYLLKPENFPIFLLGIIITLIIGNIFLWWVIKTKGEKIFAEI